MSAAGQIIPHRFISPRAKINQRPALNAPADAVTVVQQNGWMNSDNFVAFLKVFFVLISYR
jgi:hypothetical protein